MEAETRSCFSTTELEEIMKIFTSFDKDGNGKLDIQEIGQVVEQLCANQMKTFDPQSVALLLKKMDKNGDNLVDWSEFLAALTEWIGEAEEFQVSNDGKKRLKTFIERRSSLIRKVSKFFSQFTRASNIDELRQSYVASLSNKVFEAFDAHMTVEVSMEEKLAKINESHSQFMKRNEVIPAFFSNTPEIVVMSMRSIVSMLDVLDAFVYPDERFEISDFLFNLFGMFLHDFSQFGNFFARIVALLNQPPLQPLDVELHCLALKILAYLAPGPRVAHTPVENIFHPRQMTFKTLIFQNGGDQVAALLLDSDYLEIKICALELLAKLASFDSYPRDVLLFQGALAKLDSMLTPDLLKESHNIFLLRKLLWTISIFCGHTHRSEIPAIDRIEFIFPKIVAVLFEVADESCLLHAASALDRLLPGHEVDPQVHHRLIDLLKIDHDDLRRAFLTIISDVLMLQNSPKLMYLEYGLLENLLPILVCPESDLRVNAVTCIEFVQSISRVINNEPAMSVLLTLLSSDPYSRNVVVKYIRFCIFAADERSLLQLVDKFGILKHLVTALSHFKSYESPNEDSLNGGVMYQIEYAQDILECVEKLLVAGYSTFFDHECVDKLGIFVSLLSDYILVKASDLTLLQSDISASLEKTTQNIVSSLYDLTSRSGSKVSNEVKISIKNMFSDALKTLDAARLSSKSNNFSHHAHTSISNDPASVVIARFVYYSDIRLFELPRNISLDTLKGFIASKYSSSELEIRIPNELNADVLINSSEILTAAISSITNSGQLVIRLSKPGYEYSSRKSTPLETGLLRISEELKIPFSTLEKTLKEFGKAAVNGKVSKETFIKGIKGFYTSSTGGTSSHLDSKLEFLFNAFDKGRDGYIDFREFAAGWAAFSTDAPLEKRLGLAFQGYDLDGNGVIDRNELAQVIKSVLYSNDNVVTDDILAAMVDQFFHVADKDKNGVLDKEEFITAAMHDKLIVHAFWKTANLSSDSKSNINKTVNFSTAGFPQAGATVGFQTTSFPNSSVKPFSSAITGFSTSFPQSSISTSATSNVSAFASLGTNASSGEVPSGPPRLSRQNSLGISQVGTVDGQGKFSFNLNSQPVGGLTVDTGNNNSASNTDQNVFGFTASRNRHGRKNAIQGNNTYGAVGFSA